MGRRKTRGHFAHGKAAQGQEGQEGAQRWWQAKWCGKAAEKAGQDNLRNSRLHASPADATDSMQAEASTQRSGGSGAQAQGVLPGAGLGVHPDAVVEKWRGAQSASNGAASAAATDAACAARQRGAAIGGQGDLPGASGGQDGAGDGSSSVFASADAGGSWCGGAGAPTSADALAAQNAMLGAWEPECASRTMVISSPQFFYLDGNSSEMKRNYDGDDLTDKLEALLGNGKMRPCDWDSEEDGVWEYDDDDGDTEVAHGLDGSGVAAPVFDAPASRVSAELQSGPASAEFFYIGDAACTSKPRRRLICHPSDTSTVACSEDLEMSKERDAAGQKVLQDMGSEAVFKAFECKAAQVTGYDSYQNDNFADLGSPQLAPSSRVSWAEEMDKDKSDDDDSKSFEGEYISTVSDLPHVAADGCDEIDTGQSPGKRSGGEKEIEALQRWQNSSFRAAMRQPFSSDTAGFVFGLSFDQWRKQMPESEAKDFWHTNRAMGKVRSTPD